MKRKLVRQGTATLMVSLPAKWIKEQNLGKGSEIDIEDLEGNLLLSAKTVLAKSQTSFQINSSTESFIRTLITNAYRRGYDKITVSFEEESQFHQLNKVIKTRLVGFEVTKKEKNYCIVENITEPSEDLFDNLLHKMLYSISELFELTINRMEQQLDSLDYEEIEERIQKYDNFCRRVISKRKLQLPKAELLWTFLVLIIHGQREIYHLNKLLSKDQKIHPDIISLTKETRQLFELVKKAYLEKKIESLVKVHALEKEIIYKKAFALLNNKKIKDNHSLYHIMIAAREIYQSNSPLVGIII